MALLGSPFAAPASGFSVGNPPANPFAAAAAAPRSAFAAPAPTTATATPSIFGSAAFGTPAATPAPAAPASSIFGALPAPSAFAAPAAFPSTGLSAFSNPLGTAGLPAFGAPAALPAFGASAPGLLFANNATAATSSATDQIMTPAQSELAIEFALNPAPQNRYCRFRYMFYNVLPPNTTPEQVKMPANVDPTLWEQARRDNPDPRRLVPVQANGFADLKIRVEEQDKMAAQQVKALEDMQKFVRSVEQRQEADTRVKLEDAKRRHQDLQLRLLRVLRKVEVLQAKGAGLQPEEERWKSKLQQMQRDLNSPTQYKARLNELASLARIQEDALAAPELVGGQELDDASLESVHKFLEEQQRGLFQLTEIIKKDTRDLQALMDSLGKPPAQLQ